MNANNKNVNSPLGCSGNGSEVNSSTISKEDKTINIHTYN